MRGFVKTLAQMRTARSQMPICATMPVPIVVDVVSGKGNRELSDLRRAGVYSFWRGSHT